MTRIIRSGWKFAVLVCILLAGSQSLMAQQKGQYQPGQYGLNAGVCPIRESPTRPYNLNYNAGQLNLQNGTPIKATGTYNVWATENFFFYVPKFKILGAKFAPFVAFPTLATGSVVLPFVGNGTDLGTGGLRSCGYVVSTPNLGGTSAGRLWVAYAFHAPTGRYTPGSQLMSVPVTGATTSRAGSTFYIPRTRAPPQISWELGDPRIKND